MSRKCDTTIFHCHFIIIFTYQQGSEIRNSTENLHFSALICKLQSKKCKSNFQIFNFIYIFSRVNEMSHVYNRYLYKNSLKLRNVKYDESDNCSTMYSYKPITKLLFENQNR